MDAGPTEQAALPLEPAAFADLPGFAADDAEAALAAFRLSARHHLEKPYKQRAVRFDAAAFAAACRAAFAVPPGAAHAFFQRHFRPHRIAVAEAGLVTAFYEPVIAARRAAEPGFRVPFLRRPEDLVELEPEDQARLDGMRFARRANGALVPHPDRAAIMAGALDGHGLDIAFVADPVDAFFAHVQGCARLVFPDGATRITYDGKSGHAFTGIGGHLVRIGEIAPDRVSMQSIRAWLAAHPQRVDEILAVNRSYIFFREAPVEDEALGPVAAAKVPLTPGRSIAVDRTLHAFGLPFFVSAPSLAKFGPSGFNRLMVAQDTGSAIIGPARADLFLGSGDAAGLLAGDVRAPAAFHILLPAEAAP